MAEILSDMDSATLRLIGSLDGGAWSSGYQAFPFKFWVRKGTHVAGYQWADNVGHIFDQPIIIASDQEFILKPTARE